MDLTIPKLARHMGRVEHVVATLAKYGLADWLSAIPLKVVRENLKAPDGQEIKDCPAQVRLRMAMAELGSTFIKLGQILSTRPDLIGADYAEELSQLQSNTTPDDPALVRQLIESELGYSVDDLFADFSDTPLASASIGQVHAARLKDGTAVVVKVQHAEIERRARADMEILVELCRLAESSMTSLQQYRPTETAQEFQKTLERELDFTREMRNAQRFKHNFEHDSTVCVAKVFPELSTRRVLTMERLFGTMLTRTSELQSKGYDLNEVARRGANIFASMVFRDGFYHADPHPGNLMLLTRPSDNVECPTIGLLDCGMTGRLDDSLREQIEDMLLAALEGDAETLVSAIVQLGELPPNFDRPALRRDATEFFETYATASMENFDISGALTELTTIIRRHHIRLPPSVSLLIKMLVVLDGTAGQLAPGFSLAEVLAPYRYEIVKRRFSPRRLMRKLRAAQRDWFELAESAPGDFSDILTRLKKGTFHIHLEHRKLDGVVNRLVLGLLSSAGLLSSTVLLAMKVSPTFYDISAVGFLGLIVSTGVAFSLWRRIRKTLE